MPDKRDHRYFFIHVMKTAGSTLCQHILANFEQDEIYPMEGHEPDVFKAYMDIPMLLSLPAERREQVRVFQGHFPYAVVDEMGGDFVTMTVLREPVARILSYLKQAVRRHPAHKGMKLEEVYEDAFHNPAFLKNHQAKIFSLGPDDEFWTYMEGITVDERRLAVAKENLSNVDVIGITEQFPSLLETLENDYGWEVGKVKNRNVSHESHDVSEAFVERIREENAMDIEFYEYALGLHEERRRPSNST